MNPKGDMTAYQVGEWMFHTYFCLIEALSIKLLRRASGGFNEAIKPKAFTSH